jgi:hypothetical protein
MRIHSVVVWVIAAASTIAYGQNDSMSQLRTARSLKCRFGEGISTVWTGGQPKTSNARFEQDVHFDAIDLKKQTARLIGNAGSNDVEALQTEIGVSFIETAPSVVDVTTVFGVYGKDRDFLAVDTRHVTFLGTSMAEQYYGSCRIWQ